MEWLLLLMLGLPLTLVIWLVFAAFNLHDFYEEQPGSEDYTDTDYYD